MKYYVLITIIFILGLMGSVAIYSNGVTKRQNDRFAREDREKMIKEIAVEKCINGAQEAYVRTWNDTCIKKGENEGCLLSGAVANAYNKSLQENKDRCYKQ